MKVTMELEEFATMMGILIVSCGEHKETCECPGCRLYDKFKVIWQREVK